MNAGATPPLSPNEVRRLLDRLQELTDEGRTVVVGGQAVYFWAYYFADRKPGLLRGAPPTSGDLDLCGNRQTVLRAAELLGGEARLPEIDHATPIPASSSSATPRATSGSSTSSPLPTASPNATSSSVPSVFATSRPAPKRCISG